MYFYSSRQEVLIKRVGYIFKYTTGPLYEYLCSNCGDLWGPNTHKVGWLYIQIYKGTTLGVSLFNLWDLFVAEMGDLWGPNTHKDGGSIF